MLLPRAGASYHVIREGFGPFWAFLKIWIEMWVSGPGSVAGVAILLGELVARLLGDGASSRRPAGGSPPSLPSRRSTCSESKWGGRTQVVLTTLKVLGLLALVGGSLLLASPRHRRRLRGA